MLKIKILKPSKAELLRQYQQLYDESTIVEVEFNSLKQEVLNRQVFIMADDEEYCLRLEKIIDKQDGLLNHYDAKFNQQNSLNDALSRQNKILKEDLQKHKNLLKDMKKNIDQHKNVVNKLKNERGAGRKEMFTEEQKARVKMLRLQGKSYRAIAKDMNCSVATVHKIINEQQC